MTAPAPSLMSAPILMGAAQASEADVTDEINRGGPALGAFVKSVGEAVSNAQSLLDANLATTAEKLSKTEINVIAVYEQQLDDDGNLLAGNPVQMKLPLINYLMPTAYQWSRVHLQADLSVSEFNGANGFNIQGKSQSFSVGASAGYSMFGGFGASGSASYSGGSYAYGGESSYSRDSAAGKLHLEATLEPRPDIQLPKPLVLQKGPRLKLTSTSRTPITSGTAPNQQVVGMETKVTAEYTGPSGPINGKSLDFKVSDPNIDYSVTPTDGQTDQMGKIVITLRRTGASFDKEKPPQPFVLRVWKGLVSTEVGLNL